MERTWTAEQKQAIEARNRNILVSAAAGSGKTAVLVERIITRIRDKKDPTDIDRLLIVTFTQAAAAEMRERIGAAIEEQLQKDPADAHLQKQSVLIHHAQITTIHSFCLYLIRNYFHTIDLEPDFRIAEEGELNLLKEDVWAEVLNRNYEEPTADFLEFVECFATGKNDDRLRDYIFQLYTFAMSYPWPKEWLDGLAENYQCREEAVENELCEESAENNPGKEESAENDPAWMQWLMSYLSVLSDDLLALAVENIALTEAEDGPVHANETAVHDRMRLLHLKECTSYRQLAETFETFSFDRLPSSRGYDGDPDKLEQFKENREEIRGTIKKIRSGFFFAPPQIMEERLYHMQPVAAELVRLTEEFMQTYREKKRDRNILDFDDLEHFALEILIDTEKKEPTEVARECRGMFAEVMIDEYQDSNLVQEYLLDAVSGGTDGIHNRFMVGDVKQSIYRFRMARPELFMEKYDTYTKEESDCQKIELHKNFRSRREVLDFTNDIFAKIMQKDLGKVAYDSEAALYVGASYEEIPGMEAEVILADSKEELLEEAGISDPVRLEAQMVAARIRMLLSHQKISGENGEQRAVRYSDIVILFRSFSGYADSFLEVLEQNQIPAHAASRTGYFQAAEIQTILAMLRILDNPRQDIPLTSVLLSPIGDMTEEQVAELRAAGWQNAFYACVLEADREKLSGETADKLEKFLEMYAKFRRQVQELPVHELIFQILEQTGYGRYVAAMPGGERRKANLDMLLEKAVAYENSSYRGLFHFIRYIDRLQKYEVDYGEAELVSENSNAVRLMTIHKSKGLEFPVVFLCGTAKQFNKQDIRSRMVLHPELGMGLDYMDAKRRVYGPTLYKKTVAKQIELENMGEELRVLYVALTRAKEKLIITGTTANLPDRLAKLSAKAVPEENQPLSFSTRATANCFLDWILPAVSSYGNRYPVYQWGIAELLQEETQNQLEENQAAEIRMAYAAQKDEAADALVAERMHAVYAWPLETVRRIKYSVSELKHRAMETVLSEEEQMWQQAKQRASDAYIPHFAGGTDTVNDGAIRGSAMHRAVECLPISSLSGCQNLQEEIRKETQKLVASGKMTEDMEQRLNYNKLIHFYESPLAQRMKRAAEQGGLYVEKPFVMGKTADEIEGDGSDTMVLIQGIIDAYFEEDGGIVLLDYKTDVVKSAGQLAARYREQLNLYQEALEKNLGKPVKEKLIYSFYLEQTIVTE